MALFRQQALDHQQRGAYGSVLLARPWSLAALTWAFVAVLMLVGVALVTLGFARRESVTGVLLPDKGLVVVRSPQAGIVAGQGLEPGQAIVAGQVLLTVAHDASGEPGAQAQADVAQSLTQRRQDVAQEQQQAQAQAALRREGLMERAQSLSEQRRQALADVALQRQRVALAEQTAQRFADLRTQRFVSDVDAQKQQADLLDQRVRLQGLERTVSALEADQDAVTRELRLVPLDAQREQLALDRSLETLDQGLAESRAMRATVLRAGGNGRVASVAVEPGQSVAEGQPLMTWVPQGALLEAELYVPSSAVGFVHPGTEVQLRYRAFPYQKFGHFKGVVREVAQAPSSVGGEPGAEPTYRVRVRLQSQSVEAFGRPQALRPGMTLDASLVLERRKLYEWVLEPLYALGSGR